MKRSVTRIWGVLALVAGIALSATSAQAAVKLRLTDLDTGATITVTDEVVGDTLIGAVGDVNWQGVLGEWNLNVTTGSVSPATILPELMHLNSVNRSNVLGANGQSNLRIEFTATDLDIATALANLTIAPLLAPGGTVTYNAYWDPANVEFSTANALPAALSGTYSLTQVVTINHTQNGTTSFDANVTVPEPASLSLFGLGLAGLSMLRRRQARR